MKPFCMLSRDEDLLKHESYPNPLYTQSTITTAKKPQTLILLLTLQTGLGLHTQSNTSGLYPVVFKDYHERVTSIEGIKLVNPKRSMPGHMG
jgi:hypothetical protein